MSGALTPLVRMPSQRGQGKSFTLFECVDWINLTADCIQLLCLVKKAVYILKCRVDSRSSREALVRGSSQCNCNVKLMEDQAHDETNKKALYMPGIYLSVFISHFQPSLYTIYEENEHNKSYLNTMRVLFFIFCFFFTDEPTSDAGQHYCSVGSCLRRHKSVPCCLQHACLCRIIKGLISHHISC